jgi:glycosyltransferase involved in cell wall biosynthesis
MRGLSGEAAESDIVRFLLLAGLADSLINFRGPLLLALLAKGHEVHVAAPDLPVGASLRLRLEEMGLRVHGIALRRAGTSPVDDVRTLVDLWRLMRRIRPDAVLGYTVKPVIYGTLAAWLAGVPNRYALITGLGYAFQGDGQRRRLQTLVQGLYRLALSKVKKVFFQNPDDEALFRQRGLLLPEIPSVVVNGSGVDVSSFSPEPLPSGSVRFLLIARLLGDKGVREYAEAARRVRARHPQARFSLVGWIDENPDAIQASELEDWVAAESVDYLGRLSDVRPAVAACSVYVLPSYREGTPRTVLEAMAMGRAVITTDAPGCRETVVEGQNGFLVPVKSVEALEQAMLKFIENPGLAAQMGESSRHIAEGKYDVNKVNAVMLREMGLGVPAPARRCAPASEDLSAQ